MDEIREVEAELRRLREDAHHYKTAAASLTKEKKTLESRNEYLVNKLKEASYVYGEAGKRLLYFINNQVNPVTQRLNDIDIRCKKLSSQDKALGVSLISVEKTLKEDFTKVDKRLTSLNENIAAMQEKIQKAIKASVRKSEKDDAELDTKLANTVTDFDAAMTALKVVLDRKISTRINVSEKRNDSKMDALREHNLLMGKDIEALKKFEGDIQGLEGKLQTIVANLTQARLDMEKLAQRVKSEMTRTKATVDDELGKVTNDVNTKLLEFASDLKQAGERNLDSIRLELKKNQTAVNKQLQGMAVDMSSFENSMNAKIRSGQANIKKELTAFGSGVDKRLSMIEASIGANTKNQKELERIFNSKIDDMIRHDSSSDERIDGVEAGLMEHMENFKDITKRRELMTKNEMTRIRKSVDQKVGHAALELERKIGLLGKDVENLKSIESEIGGIAAEVRKRKEESAAISAKIGAISQEMTDKSEKDDMKIKEQLDMMQSDMRTSLGTAESRIVKDNAGLLSTVRQTLKKDIQSLKEHHAAMKTEIKNLRGLGSAVNNIQQAVTATQKKVDDTVNNVERISTSVSSDVEKQALEVSKDMAGISASLKADLKDIIAKEKQSFAAQSAELDARYAAIAEKAEELAGQASGNYQTSTANKKEIAQLNRRVSKLLKEIMGLKKEYKIEMGKLLKDLGG